MIYIDIAIDIFLDHLFMNLNKSISGYGFKRSNHLSLASTNMSNRIDYACRKTIIDASCYIGSTIETRTKIDDSSYLHFLICIGAAAAAALISLLFEKDDFNFFFSLLLLPAHLPSYRIASNSCSISIVTNIILLEYSNNV